MPKTGLDSSEWIRRLRLFGKGEYVFGRGNEPPPNSKWAKKRALIDACALKKARADIFGNRTQSKCDFHHDHVSV